MKSRATLLLERYLKQIELETPEGINVILVNNFLYHWRVEFQFFDQKSDEKTICELIFPATFDDDPPEVKVLHPNGSVTPVEFQEKHLVCFLIQLRADLPPPGKPFISLKSNASSSFQTNSIPCIPSLPPLALSSSSTKQKKKVKSIPFDIYFRDWQQLATTSAGIGGPVILEDQVMSPSFIPSKKIYSSLAPNSLVLTSRDGVIVRNKYPKKIYMDLNVSESLQVSNWKQALKGNFRPKTLK